MLVVPDPNGFAFTETQVGQVFIGMSITQVTCTSLFAKLTDQIEDVPGIIGGCTMMSIGLIALPLFCVPNHTEQMSGALILINIQYNKCSI
jgi:hypothetical protein